MLWYKQNVIAGIETLGGNVHKNGRGLTMGLRGGKEDAQRKNADRP